MEQVSKATIFLASPSDVSFEREGVRKVVNELNRTSAKEKGIVLMVVGWETDTYPLLGADAQSIINEQLPSPDRCDLFLGIMWNRFGSQTPRANSGTEEEFNRALDAHTKTGQPNIMFLFNRAPSSLNTEEELEQRGKVVTFRKRLQGLGLVGEYNGAGQFEEVLRGYLQHWLGGKKIKVPHSQSPPSAESVLVTPKPTQTNWILLDSRFYQASSIKEHSDGSIELYLKPQTEEDDAALRSLRPEKYGRHGVINYAGENDGFLAQIRTVDRESNDSGGTWHVSLEPATNRNQSIYDDMAYNNYSSDDLATMRARLILLNELPREEHRFGMDTRFLMSFVSGGSNNSGVEITSGIFPKLYENLGVNDQIFLRLARLWAIFHLKASNTCEHVLALNLGPISNRSMKIDFRGRRRKKYSNLPASEITVEGICQL